MDQCLFECFLPWEVEYSYLIEGRKEMCLTINSTHFIYNCMALDTWSRITLMCRGNWLPPLHGLLLPTDSKGYVPSYIQDNTHHGLF